MLLVTVEVCASSSAASLAASSSASSVQPSTPPSGSAATAVTAGPLSIRMRSSIARLACIVRCTPLSSIESANEADTAATSTMYGIPPLLSSLSDSPLSLQLPTTSLAATVPPHIPPDMPRAAAAGAAAVCLSCTLAALSSSESLSVVWDGRGITTHAAERAMPTTEVWRRRLAVQRVHTTTTRGHGRGWDCEAGRHE